MARLWPNRQGASRHPRQADPLGRDSENAAVEGALSELCGLSRNGSEPPDRPRGALIPSPKAALWRRPAVVTRSSGSLSTWRAGWSSRCWPPSRTRNRGKLLTVDAPSWARPRTLRAAGRRAAPNRVAPAVPRMPPTPCTANSGRPSSAVSTAWSSRPATGSRRSARAPVCCTAPRPHRGAAHGRAGVTRLLPAAHRKVGTDRSGLAAAFGPHHPRWPRPRHRPARGPPRAQRRRPRAPPPPLTSPAPPSRPPTAPRAAPPHPAPTSAAGHVPLAHVLPPPPQLRHSRWSGLRCPRHGPG